jgi:hypothetical protein
MQRHICDSIPRLRQSLTSPRPLSWEARELFSTGDGNWRLTDPVAAIDEDAIPDGQT